jgi:hypothetical protein
VVLIARVSVLDGWLGGAVVWGLSPFSSVSKGCERAVGDFWAICALWQRISEDLGWPNKGWSRCLGGFALWGLTWAVLKGCSGSAY